MLGLAVQPPGNQATLFLLCTLLHCPDTCHCTVNLSLVLFHSPASLPQPLHCLLRLASNNVSCFASMLHVGLASMAPRITSETPKDEYVSHNQIHRLNLGPFPPYQDSSYIALHKQRGWINDGSPPTGLSKQGVRGKGIWQGWKGGLTAQNQNRGLGHVVACSGDVITPSTCVHSCLAIHIRFLPCIQTVL